MTVRACRIEELPPGSRKIVPGGRFGIGVFNSGGALYALANRCPHDGAPVCLGPVTGTTESERSYDAKWVKDGEILRCPWHGWEFELATGKSVALPPKNIRTYPVRVENGWVIVDD
jgi:nitrite reductase/ring-hydroxylating ferredoxin subunit